MSGIHKNITIKGRVQGVFFRASACRMAEQLGVGGIVKNNPDGSVYAEAEGTAGAVRQFIDWCSEGPKAAHVTSLEVTEGKIQHYEYFRMAESES